MLLSVIKKPVITERSLALANSENMYTFAVDRAANKHQITQALSELYDVTVLKVRTITVQARQKRTGRKRIKVATAKQKKALVWLKKGDTIEAFAITAS